MPASPSAVMHRATPFRSTLAADTRTRYTEMIRDGSIGLASTAGGQGIPLDVLQTMQTRAPGAAGWSDVTEYYAVRVGAQQTYASITEGRAGEMVHVFNATGRMLASGSYPVDDDGKASGDVMWR